MESVASVVASSHSHFFAIHDAPTPYSEQTDFFPFDNAVITFCTLSSETYPRDAEASSPPLKRDDGASNQVKTRENR